MLNEITTKMYIPLTTDSRDANISRADDALVQMVDGGITQDPSDTTSTAGMLGVTFSNTTPTNTTQIDQTKQKRFHPVFNDLVLTPDGKVDTNQFSVEALKAKYNNEKYEIIEERNEDDSESKIIVKNKITGKLVEQIEKKSLKYIGTIYTQIKYDNQGNKIETFDFRNNQIGAYTSYTSPQNYKQYTYIDGDINKIQEIITSNENGQTETLYENNQISERIFRDNDYNILKKERYINGELYAEYGENEKLIKHYIAEDCLKCFNEKGQLKDVSSFEEIIFKTLNEKTISDTAEAFRKLANSDIRIMIDLCSDLTEEQKDKYIARIDELLSANQRVDGGYNSARKLLMAKNDDDFKKQVLELDKNNIQGTILKYGGYYSVDNYENFIKHSYKTITEEIDKRFSDKETKLELYNHIIEQLIEYGKNYSIYNDDILNDIKSHPEDFEKLSIDIKRLTARNDSIGARRANDTESNGMIDQNFKQGKTGDCWLLSGIISIVNKNPDFFKFSKNPDGSITVTLAGVNKTYTISKEEIEKSKHLTSGEGDVRALEIAVDRYLKEVAYKEGIEKDDDNTDIIGGYTKEFFKMVLGNGKHYNNPKLEKFDFNDPNKVFALGIEGEINTPYKAFDEKNNLVELHINHAYSIKGEDEKFIYLINPHDSSKTIKISKEEVANMNIRIDVAKLK